MAKKLTAKQELFAYFYADLLNGTKAAKKAGYKGTYSTLSAVASENLRKPNISELVTDLLKVRAMPQEEILARLTSMARGELSTKLTQSSKGNYEDFDTKSALETLARIEQMIHERIEHTGEVAVTFKVQYGNPDAGSDDQDPQPPLLAAPNTE